MAPLSLPRAATALAAALLLAPAAAGASTGSETATMARGKPIPSVSTVHPMTLAIGDTLTIRGRNFRRGRATNTVVFQRDGAKAVFVKAGIGTTKLLKVTIPGGLERSLRVTRGVSVATRFRIRILAARFGRRFTSDALSPVIGAKAVAVAPPVTAPADGDCDGDGIKNAADPDDDNDLLGDATELRFRLQPCEADSDGDAVGDGYEYRSARDLNDDEHQEQNRFLPYPGKRPYPNPLDGGDANTDFDGDVLTLSEEFRLWVAYGNRAAGLDGLNYSDGLQCSISTRGADGRRVNTLRADTYDKQAQFLAWAAATPNPDSGAGGYLFPHYSGSSYHILDFNHDGVVRETATGGYAFSERSYFDLDGDGSLCDNERDEDADGLTNYDEAHGRVTNGYWSAQYGGEQVFPIAYGGTDLTDPDSDGDEVRDGADDLDHDDIPNLAELSRHGATGDESGVVSPPRAFDDPDNLPDPADSSQPQGRVNPLNPCLPNRRSRTCLRHPPLGGAGAAPFDGSPNYFVLN